MSSPERVFLKTPVGYLEVIGSKKGISGINFLKFHVKVTRTPHNLKDCVLQLNEYFAGTRKDFTVKLDLEGTPFQMKVWEQVLKIPYGTTISYFELARRVGDIRALRAVGGANANNPVPIIIPCHRVIGADGRLMGYGGGLKLKKWLLEHEHALAQRDLFYSKV
ncbi:MAG TPA: methylated-DNA--[protein]-cysteine S-methyltransferase [Bacteroidales bacterium]|nr:methylated-DNA--[protein]-cysteine S-methyltransferase [Bacteroidales bacterium]